MTKIADTGVSGLARPAFRPDVQGLRAVAVAIVVLYHAGLSFDGGFVGVDVFFVLSGFVIMRGLHHELATTGSVDLLGFARRRVRRLLPAFALLLTVVLPLGLLVSPIDGFLQAQATAFAAVFFNANTFFHLSSEGYFSASAELNPLLHTWSLSVEEQFYLAFPTAMLLSWRFGDKLRFLGGRGGLMLSLAAVGLVSLVAAEILASGRVGFSIGSPWGDIAIDERVAFFSTPTRAWEFAAGALIAFVRPTKSPRLASIASVGGLVAIAVCCFIYTSPGTIFPGLAAVAPVAATVALLWAGGLGPVGRIMSSAPMQRIGDLSYGWYLWHWPLIVYAKGLTVNTEYDSPWLIGGVALLALIPAELSMRLLENPIRRANTMSPTAILRLGVACAFIPLLVTTVSVLGWTSLHQDTIDNYDAQFAIHLDATNGCDSNFNSGGDASGECTFTVDAPIGTVVLIGDSNAGHFSEAIRGSADAAGYDLELTTRSSCLFADLRTAANGLEAPNCTLAVELTTEQLINDGVDIVVLGHAADAFIADPDFAVIDETTNQMVSAEHEKRDLIATGFGRKIAELVDAGIEVFVVQPVPRPHEWEPGACSVWRWVEESAGCPGVVLQDDLDQQRESMAPINEEILRAGGQLLDVSSELCDADGCEILIDGSYLYRDSLHLSIAGSESLAGFFAEEIFDMDSEPGSALPFAD